MAKVLVRPLYLLLIVTIALIGFTDLLPIRTTATAPLTVNSPTALTPLQEIKQIASSGLHTCALTNSSAIQCWGYNEEGELGDGTTTNQLTPVGTIGISTATAITIGSFHTCALLTGGTVQCWGRNEDG